MSNMNCSATSRCGGKASELSSVADSAIADQRRAKAEKLAKDNERMVCDTLKRALSLGAQGQRATYISSGYGSSSQIQQLLKDKGYNVRDGMIYF